jgi:serine/threonine protein phosphatase PrpC
MASGVSDLCFGGVNPLDVRTPIQVSVKDEIKLCDPSGNHIGSATICAGGEQYRNFGRVLFDDSIISAGTVIGSKSEKQRDHQQDGFYAAHLDLPTAAIKIFAVADGLGCCPDSHIVSTAFLQGIHMAIVRRLAEPEWFNAPHLNAYDVFEQGSAAIGSQIVIHETHPMAATVAAVAVIIDNDATIASVGDSMLTHSRRTWWGRYKTLGYTNIDCDLGKILTKVCAIDEPNLYVIHGLQDGDRLTLASDGLWENIVKEYKDFCSREIHRNRQIPRQKLFALFNRAHAKLGGCILSADDFIRLAHREPQLVAAITRWVRMFNVLTEDNTTAVIYDHRAIEGRLGRFEIDRKFLELERIGW